MKKIIKKKLAAFFYFYSVLRGRTFGLIGLSMLVGLLDSLGLSMFMPLLHLVTNGSNASAAGASPVTDWLFKAAALLHLQVTLSAVLVLLVVFFTIKGLVRYVELMFTAYAQEHFISTVRNQLLNDFNRFSYLQYVAADMGQTQNVMTAEVERLSQAVIYYLRSLQQLFMVVVYICLAFVTNPVFALLVCIGGFLSNLIYKLIQDKTRLASARFSGHANEYQSKIIQHVSFFKYLKATGTVMVFSDRIRGVIREVERQRKRIQALSAVNMASREPVLILIIVGVLAVQIQWLHSPLAPILVSLLLFYRALSSLANMQMFYASYVQNSGSIKNINAFRSTVAHGKAAPAGAVYTGLQQGLELRGVSLSLGGNRLVLDHISLSIKKNESVAFVGASGCGKSTLLSLLTGLYLPDTGTFSVDSVPLSNLDVRAYQQRIGFITQEPVIFSDTIFNNITLWAGPTPANNERFQAVIQQAALGEFLNQLPQKEQTILGHNGVNLSGGQRQRIAIARELFKDIDLLVLDEATSALDSATEKIIQKNIDDLRGKYTILIVAHRLSTVRNVDRIVLLKNGRIAGQGSFSDLLLCSEDFRRMVQLQDMDAALVS